MRRFLLPCLGILSGALAPEAASAQSALECPGCATLSWTVRAHLDLGENGFPTDQTSVALLGRRVFMAPLHGDEHRIAVIEPSGAIRMLGGLGEGPGEFVKVTRLRASATRLHVFSRGRETIFDEDVNLVAARQVVVPVLGGAVALSGDRSVVQGWVLDTSTGAGGLAFHLLTSEGRVAFGPRIGTHAAGRSARGTYVLGPADGESFWSVRRDGYEFRRWSASGELVQELTPDPPFPFEPADAERALNPLVERLPPTVSAVHQDAEGHLWVAVAVAPLAWRPVDGEPTEYSPALLELVLETLVEVIDIESGRPIARARVPRIIDEFVGDGVAKSWRTDDAGLIQVDLLQFTLDPGP